MATRLTDEDLARFWRGWEQRLPGLDASDYELGVAMDVWTHFLGEKWARAHFSDNPKDPFFLLDAPDDHPFDGWVRQNRIWRGAYMLRNVQHVEGFDQFLAHLRTSTLAGAVAELAAVDALVQAKHPVRFNEQGPVKTLAYDAEATINGLRVAVEVKANEGSEEGEEYRESLIRNKIKKASKQVPSDMPSLVFIQIPSSWMKYPDPVIRTTKESLDGARRISAVVLMGEAFQPGMGGAMGVADLTLVVKNAAARHPIPNVLDIMDNAVLEVHHHPD